MTNKLTTCDAATINWGIIGCGDVTEKKSGPAFSSIAGSKLVAVMRRDRAKAEDYARRHHVPRAYDSVEALLADPEVNAVYIATPPSFHCEIALQVASAGLPCYVEKPMATTATECQQMVTAFADAGLPLFVAYYRRALPHFARVRQIIESQEFGALRQIVYAFANGQMKSKAQHTDWRFDPAQSGGGLVWDLGSHALDLLDFWAGPLDHVSGHLSNQANNSAVEEVAALTALSTNGVSVAASWNFLSTENAEKVMLSFDNGTIECSVFGPPEIVIKRGGETPTESFELPDSIQLPLIQNVVDSLKGNAEPLSTGASAMRTNHVIDQLKPLTKP